MPRTESEPLSDRSVLPVSVVIPTFRRPRMVERAIRSVSGQSMSPAEVIVVDDHSGDDTRRRAEAMGVRVITHSRNLGEGAARNTGIEAAAHDWIALLDSDDEWLPDHLETLWAAREGHVVLSTAALGFGEDPTAHRVFGWTGRRPRVINAPDDVLVHESKLVPSAVLLRRDVLRAAGGFTPRMPLAGDLDTWVRLLERGRGLAIPRVTVLYHLHSGQVSSDRSSVLVAHREILDRYADRWWHSRELMERYAGGAAWDSARADLRAREPFPVVALRLTRELASPYRAKGMVQMLVARYRGRRMAAQWAPGRAPLVARLPGTTRPVVPPNVELDLRRHSQLGAILHLLRRPASAAIVPSRIHGMVLRAGGVTSIILDQR